MSKIFLALCACALLAAPLSAAETAEVPGTEWVTVDAAGDVSVHLYFFWTATCPHCQRAKPFVETLPDKYPWLQLHSHVLDREHRDHVSLYVDMARALGKKAGSVPAFLFCGKMFTGYDEESTTGAFLVDGLRECHETALETGGQIATLEPETAAEEPALSIPLIGELDVEAWSLPALTLVLAGLDSFNPCAFFVLLFLLSLLVHARSRQRMLIIGGTFVFFSGFIYFLFMAAWLNLFLVIGNTQWVTLGAGLVALVLGLINIKDFVWFKRGVSLSIPDDAKPKLYERMRGLVAADNLAAMMLGAIALSIAANSYELLCTAGFPMVFTRALTLNDLPTSSYYLYLVFYNVIYVIPLLLIVGVFVATLGSRKLSEREGRVLKLLSGLMMFELGVVLVFAPAALNNVMTAVVLLVVALALTFVLTRFAPKAPTA
ncbi:MAG: thioredoxin family protein [Gammaproteobacteria bacterium]